MYVSVSVCVCVFLACASCRAVSHRIACFVSRSGYAKTNKLKQQQQEQQQQEDRQQQQQKHCAKMLSINVKDNKLHKV